MDGKKIDAVAQITKLGFVFILDRDSGKPLFPVDEVPVPDSSTLTGEKPWSTQPFPRVPGPFASQSFTEADVNPFVPDSSQAIVKRRLGEIESGNIFLPPSEKGILIFPGLDGGGEWGGAGYDPKTGFLYINANHSPWILKMVKKEDESKPLSETVAGRGQKVYGNNCMSCHGTNREGNGVNPALQNITKKYTAHQILNIVNNGRGMMPSFEQITSDEKKALLSFLVNDQKEGSMSFIDSSMKKGVVQNPSKVPFVPYIPVYQKFRTPEGYPANKPPWGTLTAINLNTTKTVWTIPIGEYPELKKKGIPVTGTENYGGPIVTSGGLLFIAATLDQKIRAFNKRTGKLLWEADLPSAGFATPSTYEVNGKQYIVIACGGGKLNTTSGDSYVAFTLP
jgi:quinoprotein glucose dehydrogenase